MSEYFLTEVAPLICDRDLDNVRVVIIHKTCVVYGLVGCSYGVYATALYDGCAGIPLEVLDREGYTIAYDHIDWLPLYIPSVDADSYVQALKRWAAARCAEKVQLHKCHMRVDTSHVLFDHVDLLVSDIRKRGWIPCEEPWTWRLEACTAKHLLELQEAFPDATFHFNMERI